jgi:hypothetical protein
MNLKDTLSHISEKTALGSNELKIGKVVAVGAGGLFQRYGRVRVAIADKNNSQQILTAIPVANKGIGNWFGQVPKEGDFCVVAMVGGGAAVSSEDPKDPNTTGEVVSRNDSCVLLTFFAPTFTQSYADKEVSPPSAGAAGRTAPTI